MKKKLLIITPILLLVGAMALWQIGKSRTFQFFGVIVPRNNTTEKIVALTFDDGPTATGTSEILKVLDEMQVKATFFLIGSELEQNLAEGRKIVAAGHEVGNHSYSHTRMLLVSPSFVREEVEKTDRLIQEAGYSKEIHFRPPYCKNCLRFPGIFLKQAGKPSPGMSSRTPIPRLRRMQRRSSKKPAQASIPVRSFCSTRCIRVVSLLCTPFAESSKR